MLAPAPGTRSYTKAIVAAQMLAQIGAFALPPLLPGYIARWDLSKTEAGWLVGICFAAYVVMVPVLVSLTDRIPARRVYMLGTGLTALAFRVCAVRRWLLVGAAVAHACRHRLGRDLHAGPQGDHRPARGNGAIARRLMARRRRRDLRRGFLCDCRPGRQLGGSLGLISPRRRDRVGRRRDHRDCHALGVAGLGDDRGLAAAAGFPAGAARPRRHGLDHRLYR